MESICYRVVVKHKTMFSSGIGHSGAHCCKLRTTFGFSRTDNCNKIYTTPLLFHFLVLFIPNYENFFSNFGIEPLTIRMVASLANQWLASDT
jgi:hypothetical protein